MPTSEDFKAELMQMLYEATKEGRDYADVSAGELHKRVSTYKSGDHRMPMACVAMLAAFVENHDTILQETPSRQSSTLTIRYRLPRLESVS